MTFEVNIIWQGRHKGIESTVSVQYMSQKSEVSEIPFSKNFWFQSYFSKIYSVPGHCGPCSDAVWAMWIQKKMKHAAANVADQASNHQANSFR